MSKEWEKQFDEKFINGDIELGKDTSGKMWVIEQTEYKISTDELKAFIKETIDAVCDELKMHKSGRHGNQNYAKGWNDVVGEINKKLESIRNETN